MLQEPKTTTVILSKDAALSSCLRLASCWKEGQNWVMKQRALEVIHIILEDAMGIETKDTGTSEFIIGKAKEAMNATRGI